MIMAFATLIIGVGTRVSLELPFGIKIDGPIFALIPMGLGTILIIQYYLRGKNK